ncbi:hypothetical protein [Flavobacterium macacae]|uniref:Outer membrane protein beta-barrel domain-containing protein n=1 Tax=Flavobacterium macacae TaxID=2488993 RepID=A0A3P3W893_9FLAO|nr:hypothetical protein [Flavobacterium macacae]RRJ88873.1 hypothetical protein EG849_14085 [Flavobacterium macacae]
MAVLTFFCAFSQYTFAQDAATTPEKYTAHNKGKFFISWGGNRDNYTKSDIHFKGDGYDFTVNDVKAHDKGKGYHVDYINPARMTIPQTNFKIGYFISDHYNVSIGIDHMKYVMTQNQMANVSGEINLPQSEAGSIHNGPYSNTPTRMTEDFLKFEHTDGLNYVNIQVNRFDDISSWFGLPNTDKFQINLTEGIGAGILYPKTNATLLSKERHDDFHISGYGLSAQVGLNFTFFKYFYIQGDLKGGYINMNDIKTTSSNADSASQHFGFLQRIVSVGGIFRL